MGDSTENAPHLSQRGAHLLSSYGRSTQSAKEILTDGYNSTNPDGWINLNASQNTLQHPELLRFLRSKFDLADVEFKIGDDLSGSRRLLRALAAFLNRHFGPWKEVEEEEIILGAGCAPVTEQLLMYLADPGEGILLPTPSFSGYKHDCMVRNGLRPVFVHAKMEDHFSTSAIPAFEHALKRAQEQGTTIRAVLLCNPNNPLGRCYPQAALLAYARFCETHNLHFVCDEIFAQSTFSSDLPNPVPFVSALSLDLAAEGCDPARVHVLYGLSKDFNANGLRGGALISRNRQLLGALRTTSHYIKMSSATALLWALVLEDKGWWETFVQENRRRLGRAYAYVTAWLRFHQIPYYPASAGHYISVNLRQFFPSHDAEGNDIGEEEEAKDDLLNRMLNKGKVLLGSAAGFNFPEKGWFRLCYSAPDGDVLPGLRRLEKMFDLPEWDGGSGL
ncbi:PLP-dependent transferase [Dacryopinax primogenitus]|uniref:PLP-dependent transferase n=1 Tax=Dacryopinax primogenitus (strain DJM 731) TaxID=1858805 RepID=M5FTT3_DACPD|nr:PLP-dependent transferase [Dacryopinax primogenitus]EJT99533.1 PLP-dependent transferase [Dacryopinax primogenitus]